MAEQFDGVICTVIAEAMHTRTHVNDERNADLARDKGIAVEKISLGVKKLKLPAFQKLPVDLPVDF